MYRKLSELFAELHETTPHSKEYYKLIRVIDSELTNIMWQSQVLDAKIAKSTSENEKQYRLF